MAVVRIKLPAQDLRVMANMIEAHHQRAARELRRAALRPGLTAELTAGEFLTLGLLAPWRPQVAAVLEEAAKGLAASLKYEAARGRGPDLGMAPHRSYHARLAHQNRKRGSDAKS